jgi:YVTN family beta-propeller protein
MVLLFLLIVLLAPVMAQTNLGTVADGAVPSGMAYNPITNKIYVVNMCGNDPSCGRTSPSTVTVIDGATDATTTITVGVRAELAAVNILTNKIYFPNIRDNTVSIIDGATNLVTAIIDVGSGPVGVDVNPFTNRIYVTNTGHYVNNTMSVIDGWTNRVIDTITVGWAPIVPVVDSLTNKIYVTNECGNDPNNCSTDGSGANETLSVVDGASDKVTATLTLGIQPAVTLMNLLTNKVYVLNICGNDPTCVVHGNGNTVGTLNVVDGQTLSNTSINVGLGVSSIAVNPLANQVYVSGGGWCGCSNTLYFINGATLAMSSMSLASPFDVEVDPLTNEIYVTDYTDNTLIMVDGVTHHTSTVGTGPGPQVSLVNPITNRIYVINSDSTVSVVAGGWRRQ